MFSESRERTVKGGGTVQSAAETAVAKQYEALLRVSQNLISIRSSEELFKVLARELRAVVNFYVMGVGIYDETAHQVHLTSYGEPGDPLEVPKLAPVQFNNAVKPLLVFAAAPYGAIGASIALTIIGAPFWLHGISWSSQPHWSHRKPCHPAVLHKLLGVHGFGQRATEIIHIGQAVLFYGGSVNYFLDLVFNYPTLAEAYKVAALGGLNKL